MNNEEMRKMWEAAAMSSDQSIRNYLEDEKDKKFGGGADGRIRRHLKDGSYDPKKETPSDSPQADSPQAREARRVEAQRRRRMMGGRRGNE